MKIVIVGGVAGGASAAARARRLSEDAQIVVFERGPDVSFANCGLPYYLGGEIAERDKLLVVTPERLRSRFKLDVRTRTSVEAIDRSAKTVRVRDLATGRVYDESYDKLILAPGAAPLRPPIPGIDLPGIFTLRNLQDVDRIKEALDRSVSSAVIVGAGFIGLELAENLVRRGIAVTVVELQDQVLPPFDREMTTPLAEELESHGVELLLGDSAESFAAVSEGLEVRLKSGGRRTAGLVILGVGVRPENGLAVAAGLSVGPRGGIRGQRAPPDRATRTSTRSATPSRSRTSSRNEPAQVPLAGPANRQGRIAADHIFGRDARYRGTQGTAIVGVFDRTAAMTGASEKVAAPRRPAVSQGLRPPGPPRRLLPRRRADDAQAPLRPATTAACSGAQAVGGAGVDKRIDVLAMAIQAGLTVFDLEEAELAYAPQYGSAKDPINMAGFVAAGLLRGEHPQVDVEAILEAPEGRRPFLLDVRTPEEFARGHIPGAVNIPVDELRQRLDEVPRDREIAAYCQVGQRGYLATRILLQSGFRGGQRRGRVPDLFAPPSPGHLKDRTERARSGHRGRRHSLARGSAGGPAHPGRGGTGRSGLPRTERQPGKAAGGPPEPAGGWTPTEGPGPRSQVVVFSACPPESLGTLDLTS